MAGGSEPRQADWLPIQVMLDPTHAAESSSLAWYGASIAEFLGTDSDSVVGRLATSSDFSVLPTQRDAWLEQIRLLQIHLVGLTGSNFLEEVGV